MALQAALEGAGLQRHAANLPDDWDIPEPPTLPEHLMWIWRAWWRLHADRPSIPGGMGPALPGRIAWRDLILWASVHDLSGDQFDMLDRCARAMDDHYCAWQVAKIAADMQAGKK